MLQKTSCSHVVSQSTFAAIIDAVQLGMSEKQLSLQYDELPSLPRIFPQFGGDPTEPVEPFPPQTKPPMKDDIVLYLHSSGSTGLPKPIAQRQIAVLQWCNSRESVGSCSGIHRR
jgi:long-subunit acyl-CoA synthetase (AMP-forming)